MTPTQSILAYAALAAAVCIAGPSRANDPNWNGDPEPPAEEPEPEPETPVTPANPTESWADRNGTLPASRPLPCCIAEGKLVPKPNLFMSAKRALMICEAAKAKGDALIYECPGQVSPEAMK